MSLCAVCDTLFACKVILVCLSGAAVLLFPPHLQMIQLLQMWKISSHPCCTNKNNVLVLDLIAWISCLSYLYGDKVSLGQLKLTICYFFGMFHLIFCSHVVLDLILLSCNLTLAAIFSSAIVR